MDKLLRKKRIAKNCLAKLYQDDGEHNRASEDSIKAAYLEVRAVFNNILEICDDASFDTYESELLLAVETHTKYEKREKTSPPPSRDASHSTSPQEDMLPQLPVLRLPTFEGIREEYHNFISQFKAAVDERPLDNNRKFQYLLSCLKGKPLKLISHLAISHQNYNKALKIIEEKYENPRQLVFDLLKKLSDLPISAHISSLEDLCDNIVCICHALETQGHPIGDDNIYFVYQMMNKLDGATAAEFRKIIGKTVPSVNQFLEFIKAKAAAIDDVRVHPTPQRNTSEKLPQPQKRPSHHSSTDYNPGYCPACREKHRPVTCFKFTSLDYEGRKALIVKNKLCFNCMHPGHTTNQCSSSMCRKCGAKHHTLLHRTDENQTSAHSVSERPEILPTARIPIKSRDGSIVHLRALLDSGSMSSFILKEAATRLRLQVLPLTEHICGVNGTKQTITEAVKFQIDDTLDSSTITALVVPEVTKNLPSRDSAPFEFPGLQPATLADSTYHKRGKIELLLASNIFFAALRPGQLQASSDNKAVALLTRFGYVIASTLPYPHTNLQMINHSTTDEDFTKLWALEQPTPKESHPDDKFCEELFQKHTVRLQDGAYQVRLPIVDSTSHLYKTRAIAMKRLYSLDKTLNKRKHQEEYQTQLMDYVDKNHMEVAPSTTGDVCYLPHHAVFKNKSTTTKMRIVFDASAAPKAGKSLNETMINGPRLQEPLAAILMRFRKHRFAITADIEKMYRQIHIHPDQFDLHRILWKGHPAAQCQEFRLKRLTFGTRAAPFLATRVLLQLSRDEEKMYPAAARALREDFYIDDAMTGAASIEEAQVLRWELNRLLSSGGFYLQKWHSNHEDLSDVREIKEVKNEEIVSTLGLLWDPQHDSFTFSVTNTPSMKLTKRKILSEAAQLFDPLGWANPVTMFARIFLQSLWKENYKWDDILPAVLQTQWSAYQQDLNGLQHLAIPRYIQYHQGADTTLCGFSDASERALAACIYLKSTHNGLTSTNLVAAKSKVAPLKTTTIPKLELSAASLLAQFMKEVQDALRLTTVETHFWTDSTITLAWIQSPSYRWETFVANRVAAIQSLSKPEQWHHVATQDNPADLPTRTISTAQLRSSSLWWQGPKFLHAQLNPSLIDSHNRTNNNTTPCCNAIPENTAALPTESCSNLNKLCRVYSYIIRFKEKLRRRPASVGTVTPTEYNNALMILVRSTQGATFGKEISLLKTSQPVQNNSTLRTLTPFLDACGNLRVLGRLSNTNLPYDQKHPLILPQDCHLTQLIIESYHRDHLHAGTSLLLASLRNKFWILGGKRAIKKITRRCTICHRIKAKMACQLMGNLPTVRTTPARPFTNTGVDYAGPIQLKPILPRSKVRLKGYICIFVCLATKAVHLEAVTTLSSDGFIAALRRFIARRGKCQSIYSDNGTNFVGADTILQEFLDNNRDDIHNALSPSGITWTFIPPHAPHFGGLWEAGVKSTKHHLRRVMGRATFTYEELSTTLAQIEACLNSRPICPLTQDPDDLAVLTPGHFLIGAPLIAPPDADTRAIPINRLSRWQLVQSTTQEFWTHWSREYLSNLQSRPKWFAECRNLKEGDIVLLHNANLPPASWQLGRIINIHPGPDKRTRVLTVKTATGTLQRPITKVSPLPIKDNL